MVLQASIRLYLPLQAHMMPNIETPVYKDLVSFLVWEDIASWAAARHGKVVGCLWKVKGGYTCARSTLVHTFPRVTETFHLNSSARAVVNTLVTI